MSAVPRKAEARVSGLERARIGAAAADARQGSARAVALEEARSIALRAFDLSAFAELAAANLDYSAKVLLELMGQGARGPCRTRAWIMRNGARIQKGERGLAVSMFGGYVWPLRSTTGRFGSVGLVECGEAPTVELEGWAELAGGDPIAGAILASLRGYRAVLEVMPAVSLERLDEALKRARGVAWRMPGCLSCDGAGCLACSCLDDKTRIGVLYSEDMPSPEPQPAAKRGRPRAVRPPLPDVERSVAAARGMRVEAERMVREARELERAAMQAAVDGGYSLGDVAAAAGVTKARVSQILASR